MIKWILGFIIILIILKILKKDEGLVINYTIDQIGTLEVFMLKKTGITVLKSTGFFLGWAILVSILPLSSSKEQAVWRLWAEIMPLLVLFPVWVLAVFVNTIMQELLVRGYLYQMLKQKHNIIVAMIVTTILFTALHGGAFEAGVIPVLNVFTMSLLMTVVLEYSGSIIAPTIMHFLWNGIGALVLGGVSLADDYPNLFVTTFTGNDILSAGIRRLTF